MPPGVADGIYGNINFGEKHFVARAAAEVAIDGGCEFILMSEQSFEQTREIGAPLARRWIRCGRESRGLCGENVCERRATHSAMCRTDPNGRRGVLECSWPLPRR